MKMNRKILVGLLILASIAIAVLGAPTKPYSDLVDGDTMTAKFLIGTFNVLFNWANGNITNSNIATSAGIIGTKLANGTITTLQILDGTILEEDLSATYTASLSAHISNSIATLSASVTAALASESSDSDAHIASSSGVHGVGASPSYVIGSTDAQEISNKTISSFTMTATPTASMHPANMGYVDSKIASEADIYLPLAGGATKPMTGNLYLDNSQYLYSFRNGASTAVSILGVDGANWIYFGDATNASGVYMENLIDMSDFKINNLGYPVSGPDAVNMNYVSAVNASIGIELTLLTDAIATWASNLTDDINNAIASVNAEIASITASGGLYLPLTGGATFPMSGDLFLDNAVNLKSKTTGGTSAALIGIDGTDVLNIGGSVASRAVMWPQLDMNSQRVTNATSPIVDDDLATKFYVDNRTATGVFDAQISSSTFIGGLSTGTEIVNAVGSSCSFVSSTFSGSYVSATDLRAGGNQITEVGTPTYDAGAVNLGYLNDVIDNLSNITSTASTTYSSDTPALYVMANTEYVLATYSIITNTSASSAVFMVLCDFGAYASIGSETISFASKLVAATTSPGYVISEKIYSATLLGTSTENVSMTGFVTIAGGGNAQIQVWGRAPFPGTQDVVFSFRTESPWLQWVRLKTE